MQEQHGGGGSWPGFAIEDLHIADLLVAVVDLGVSRIDVASQRGGHESQRGQCVFRTHGM